MFAIDVERSRALEWSGELGTWRELDPAGQIADPALAVALPIEAMIHAAKADDAVQRALIAKGNRVLEAHVASQRAEAKAEGLQEGLARGQAEGKAAALLAVLAARGIAVGDVERAQILGEQDPGQLDRWLAGAVTCTEAAELFMMRGGR